MDKYLNKINFTDSCWLWTGTINSDGYGIAHIKLGNKWVHRKAHRIIYELHNGKIPDNLVCDHLCRVRNCVNPNHIEIVTQSENRKRGEFPSPPSKYQTHCKHGHEMNEENTRIGRFGYRICRACARRFSKENYNKNKKKLNK